MNQVTMNQVARRLLATASASVDQAMLAAIELRNRKARAFVRSLSIEQRLSWVESIRSRYSAPELIADRAAFFPRPGPVHPRVQRVRALPDGGECLQLSWPSAFVPFDSEAGERYLKCVPNRTAHARLYVQGRGRPAVILVHGYMTGQWAIEEQAWPIAWMQKCGLDVAIAVLPFHGLRAQSGEAPPFPGSDASFTNEGFRQATADLRVLMDVLRDRGAPAVGMMGMSLGGYTSALMATLEPSLAFAAPLIPLASVGDFAHAQGRLGSGLEADTLHAALEAANTVVSPFARPSLLPPSRVLVVGAEGDRVTPLAHAERIASHLQAPLLTAAGGHILQVWRREAFRAVRALLTRDGIL